MSNLRDRNPPPGPAMALPARSGSSAYPQDLRPAVDGRSKRALGDAFGLDQFGVNLTELAPGAASALRHWHEREDEFVYVLSGHPTLITEAGAIQLNPGDCAGFKAGTPDAHAIVNRGETPAILLEVGSRSGNETCRYPDQRMIGRQTAGQWRFDRE